MQTRLIPRDAAVTVHLRVPAIKYQHRRTNKGIVQTCTGKQGTHAPPCQRETRCPATYVSEFPGHAVRDDMPRNGDGRFAVESASVNGVIFEIEIVGAPELRKNR